MEEYEEIGRPTDLVCETEQDDRVMRTIKLIDSYEDMTRKIFGSDPVSWGKIFVWDSINEKVPNPDSATKKV